MLEPAAERCELDTILTRLETAVGALGRAIGKLNSCQPEKLETNVCVTESPSLAMPQEPNALTQAPMQTGDREQKLEGLAGHLVQLEDRAGCVSSGLR